MSKHQIVNSLFHAITTKFLVPTHTQGSRCKAKCSVGSVTVPWDHAKSSEDNHRAAAQKLIDKFDWRGKYVGGHLDEGMCFVCVANHWTNWYAFPELAGQKRDDDSAPMTPEELTQEVFNRR